MVKSYTSNSQKSEFTKNLIYILKIKILEIMSFNLMNLKIKSSKKSKTKFHEENFCKSLMKNRMINELQNEIVPGGLKEDDLNSMYNSIENRSPYLDTRLFQDC